MLTGQDLPPVATLALLPAPSSCPGCRCFVVEAGYEVCSTGSAWVANGAGALLAQAKSYADTVTAQAAAGADITMPAAEPVSGGDFVTLTTDGVVRASASDLDRPAHGFVKTAASAGQTCSIYRKGRITGLSGLARGTTYYLSSINAGKPTPTPAGAFSQQVGVGAADDTLLVEIEPPILTH